jgi:hypothetical protein
MRKLSFAGALVAGALAAAPRPAAAEATPQVLFYSGFEAAEGYDAGKNLRGQQGWLGEGSGGNGLVRDFFEGLGQQAFVGYAPPAPKDEVLSVWRPFHVPAPAPDRPVWKFSVWMQVVDSTNGEYDDFRWSAYNTEGHRLFSLDFDNAALEINYLLDDDQGFRSTGFTFSTEVVYRLEIWLNFARNNWQAVMNGQVVVDAQPITTTGARLDLSDIGAVWALRTKGRPGDNYLLFDEYQLTIEPTDHIPATLELAGFNTRGEFELYLHAERHRTFALDVSADFKDWTPLATNRLAEGYWFFTDTTAPGYPVSFYRAREVLP